MSLTLSEVKLFIQVDCEEEDILIENLIVLSKEYIKNSIGVAVSDDNETANYIRKVLIKDWYDNRDLIQDKKTSDKVRYTIRSLMLQLKYGG